jgi:protein tyrosine/serine phosphatase
MLLALTLAAALSSAERPNSWAQPIALSGAGNLHKVNDSLYRSEQPTDAGMHHLADSLGIRTVINLRAFHSDKSKIKGTGLGLHELDINTWNIKDADVIRALRIIRWSRQGPYLVHCQHGADRTGTVNAVYRMVFQNWSREEAIREMTEGGYHFHSMWKNILAYMRKVDADAIRKAVETQPEPRNDLPARIRN